MPAALCILGVLCGDACGQLPRARLDRVFPLGGEAGSEVVLEVSGKDLDGATALHFDCAGFRAVALGANRFRVTIGPDVPPGTHDVRVVGRYGISGARLFAVSRGLTEVREAEPNDTPAQAQAVPMNVAVNGTSDANGDDYSRFPARKGERVTIDCQAFRLDSTLRATLTLAAAGGRELAQSRPYYDRTDPLLDFVAPADGQYVLGLHDATYAGGLPYRLVISNRPQVENAFPPAVVPGAKTVLTLLGRNLPGGKPAPDAVEGGLPLERLTVPFNVPRDAAAALRFDFVNALPSPNLNARGLQWWPPVSHALNPVALAYADAPVTLEREPNDSPAAAQEVRLPAVVCGRFDRPGDADWYAFHAKAGQAVAVDLLCERLDFPGDPFVIVTDAKGSELASFDDHGINFNALAQYNRDPVGTFTAPADGTYRLLVQERYRKGGPRYQYVLRLGPPEPDFYPVAVHDTAVDPACPLVRRGGSAYVDICLNRRNYTGPVTVEADGLPPGGMCPPVHVSPQTEFGTVVFTAAADAPEWAGPVRLRAWATVEGRRIECPVRWCQRRWAIDNINTSRACREVCLAVRDRAPYALTAPTQPASVAAGGTAEVPVRCRRLWPDFTGPVQLTGLNLPPGFTVPTTDLPAGRAEVAVKVQVADNVPPGVYTVNLRGDAQVPYARDPKASKANVRVADPATPLTLVVKPAKPAR